MSAGAGTRIALEVSPDPLAEALEILEKAGCLLHYLPPENESESWKALAAEHNLSVTQTLALKFHMRQLSAATSGVGAAISTPEKRSAPNPRPTQQNCSASKAKPSANAESELAQTVDGELDWVNHFNETLHVGVNGNAVDSSSEFIAQLKTSTPLSLQQVKRFLLVDEQLAVTPEEIVALGVNFDVILLRTEGEKKYQKTFDKANKKTPYLLRTSPSNKRTPIPTREVFGHFHFRRKVDNQHALRPIGIEFKGEACSAEYDGGNNIIGCDFDVIRQAIERTCLLECMGNHIANVVMLGVTHCRMWVVIFRRQWLNNDEDLPTMQEHLNVLRCEPIHLAELWALLSKEVLQDRNMIFVNPGEAFHTARFINSLCGYHGYTRIIARGASTSKVFSITFPVKHDRSIAVSRTQKHVAIKVVLSDTDYLQELACIKQFCSSQENNVLRDFYACGFMSSDDTTPTFFSDEWRECALQVTEALHRLLNVQNADKTASELDNDDGYEDIDEEEGDEDDDFNTDNAGAIDCTPWWKYVPQFTQGTRVEGGIIIMRCAESSCEKIRLEEIPEMISDVCGWLHRIHTSGVIHCDLRWRNVMYFGQQQLFVGDNERAKKASANTLKKVTKEVKTMKSIPTRSGRVTKAADRRASAHANKPNLSKPSLNNENQNKPILSKGWQLVDFSLAETGIDATDNTSRCESNVTSAFQAMSLHASSRGCDCIAVKKIINKNFGQYRGAGFTVKLAGSYAAQDVFEHRWKQNDDWQMLIKMISLLIVRQLVE